MSHNVLFISVDQLTAATIANRNDCLSIPNINSLAANGICFDRAYCSDPACAPARSTWMTGLFPSEIGTVFNGAPVFDDVVDLGSVLRGAGCRPVHAGKWHVEGRDVHDSFDVLFYGQRQIEAGAGEFYDVSTTHAAMAFLLNQAAESAPFFLHASYVNPHDICEFQHSFEDKPPPELTALGLLDESWLPKLPDNFNFDPREIVSQRVMRRGGDALIHGPIEARLQHWNTMQWRAMTWHYHRFIERVDTEIGLLLDALAQSGLADDTVIVFSSDHGESNGHHRMFQKFTLYEESIRVPLIIASLGSWSFGEKGRRNDTYLVSGADMMPTLCTLLGVAVPAGLPGRSIVPALSQTDAAEPETVYVECNYWSRALVDLRWKYVYEYMPNGDGSDATPPRNATHARGLEELYDLIADPGETVNLAYDRGHTAVIERFRVRADQVEADRRSRPLTDPRAVETARRWGDALLAYWQKHPELDAMRSRNEAPLLNRYHSPSTP